MQRIIIIALIVLIVGAFMATETIQFNQKAVRTTFGRADEGDVIQTPGLRFKIPWIQRFTKYDVRVRFIQSDLETQQTLDKSQLLVQSFLTWRVSDPLKFYKFFGGAGDSTRAHFQSAENILKGKLRTAAAAISSYNASDLLSATEKASKIRELETAMLEALKGTRVGDAALSDYGIEPVDVGIASLGLPQQTTAQVFQRMKSAREKIANQASSEGRSEAAKIRSAADADAQKIAAFTDQLAKSIRAKGETEAVEYLKDMKADPQLAVFIQNMDFIRNSFGKTLTLVIPTNMPGFEFLRPDTASQFRDGKIPYAAPDPAKVVPSQQPAPSAKP